MITTQGTVRKRRRATGDPGAPAPAGRERADRRAPVAGRVVRDAPEPGARPRGRVTREPSGPLARVLGCVVREAPDRTARALGRVTRTRG
jgi:hypothetical protein